MNSKLAREDMKLAKMWGFIDRERKRREKYLAEIEEKLARRAGGEVVLS